MRIWWPWQSQTNGCLNHRTDVTKYDVLKATFAEIVKDFGRIDGL